VGVKLYVETQNIRNATDTCSELLQDKSFFMNMKFQQTERKYLILKRRKKKNKGRYLYFGEIILNQIQVLLQ
jgi:hypothetical protein